MKKVISAGILFLLFGIFLVLQIDTKNPEQITTVTESSETEAFGNTNNILATSTIGRLFMIGHWAETPVEETSRLIEEYGFAGVIIMSAPENPAKISSWTTAWQLVSENQLLIAIDQEGGPVSRLKTDEFIQTAQKEISTPEEAFAVGLTRGQELKQLGINMNFAPVLDTAEDPDSFMYSRTFPQNADSAELAATMADGMREAGVIAVAKHFPGHDDTEDDSHTTLPLVSITKNELVDFVLPFTTFINTFSPEALMTAHVQFTNIDPVPATLSSFFLGDFLRNDLKFSGAVITDDMSMDAVETIWGSDGASVMALEAGADLILFAAEPYKAPSAFETIRVKSESDENFRIRLIEASQRVESLQDVAQ